jgi:hypothetical protein
MRHLKIFESNTDKKKYVMHVIDENITTPFEWVTYIFDTDKDRELFTIDFIHKDFMNAGDYESVENIFDIDDLLEIFRDITDKEIYFCDGEYVSKVQLSTQLQLHIDKTQYNL